MHETVYSTRCWKNKWIYVLCGRLDLAQLHRRSREKLNHTPIAQLHSLIIPCISSCDQEPFWKSGWKYPLAAADTDSDVYNAAVKVTGKWVKCFVKAKEFTLVIGCLSHRVLVDTNYAPNTGWVTSSVPRQHLPSVLRLSRSSWLQKVWKPMLNPVTPYVGGLCNYNLSSLIRGRQSEKAERAARQYLIRDAVCVCVCVRASLVSGATDWLGPELQWPW